MIPPRERRAGWPDGSGVEARKRDKDRQREQRTRCSPAIKRNLIEGPRRRRLSAISLFGNCGECSSRLRSSRLLVHHVERDEPTRVFIPEREAQCGEALAQRHDGRAMKYGILVVTLLKIVVRNPRAEMMDVMKADAARNPLQNAGETEKGASRDGGGSVIPPLVLFPICTLELVLHEEEPEARGDGEIVGRQVDEKDARAKERHESSANDHDGGVRDPDTRDLSSTSGRSTRRKSLVEDEEQWSDKQKGQWVSAEPVAEAPPRRPCEILSDGQCRNVAMATTVEVARRRVVQCMLVPPVLEGYECEHTSNSADHAIRSP